MEIVGGVALQLALKALQPLKRGLGGAGTILSIEEFTESDAAVPGANYCFSEHRQCSRDKAQPRLLSWWVGGVIVCVQYYSSTGLTYE